MTSVPRAAGVTTAPPTLVGGSENQFPVFSLAGAAVCEKRGNRSAKESAAKTLEKPAPEHPPLMCIRGGGAHTRVPFDTPCPAAAPTAAQRAGLTRDPACTLGCPQRITSKWAGETSEGILVTFWAPFSQNVEEIR